jgi:hypothetical protein
VSDKRQIESHDTPGDGLAIALSNTEQAESV